jgi:hypothetical protein
MENKQLIDKPFGPPNEEIERGRGDAARRSARNHAP